ncbi:MAG: alpha/beta hydrolase [Alphaproteobacteria bacterium]
MPDFVEKRFTARDGLSLYYRDFPGPPGKTPVLCLSGTTGNSKQYEDIALRLRAQRRVLCMDWRGHGRSDYDPDWEHYSFFVDRDDVLDLLAHEELDRVLIVGTSLGGIVTMHIALERPEVIAGVVMNDVGPVIGAGGRQRLHDNMGKPMVFSSYEEAAAAQKERAERGFTLSDAEWLARTKQTFRERDGKIVPDMDPVYGKVFRSRKRPPDWWDSWTAMKDTPVLVVRGAVSDILDEEVLAEMARRKPDMRKAIVPGRGHCPSLSEPEAVAAIDDFLAGL